MKKPLSIAILCALFLLACGSKDDKKGNDYLFEVLHNLEKVQSATYNAIFEIWIPGDTIPKFIQKRYTKEYVNPDDSTIGSSFVELLLEDTTQMAMCYDGKMIAVANKEEKTTIVDSFNIQRLPFRPLQAPFFNYTKSIINYALETRDSILKEVIDLGDSIVFKLTIFGDNDVEFFGRAYYMEKPPNSTGAKVSRYEIWISKSTGLPIRVRREIEDDISVIICNNVEINKTDIKDFYAPDYFHPEYPVIAKGSGENIAIKNEMIGKNAPNWVLKDSKNNDVSLSDFKSNILMIQFTSVTCGPCKLSISFLKQLESEYNKEVFNLVSIENRTKNTNVLKVYQERNHFNYSFLMTNEEVSKAYQVKDMPVPIFFILDKNRMIRKVIRGYSAGATDKEIRDAITELLTLNKGSQ